MSRNDLEPSLWLGYTRYVCPKHTYFHFGKQILFPEDIAHFWFPAGNLKIGTRFLDSVVTLTPCRIRCSWVINQQRNHRTNTTHAPSNINKQITLFNYHLHRKHLFQLVGKSKYTSRTYGIRVPTWTDPNTSKTITFISDLTPFKKHKNLRHGSANTGNQGSHQDCENNEFLSQNGRIHPESTADGRWSTSQNNIFTRELSKSFDGFYMVHNLWVLYTPWTKILLPTKCFNAEKRMLSHFETHSWGDNKSCRKFQVVEFCSSVSCWRTYLWQCYSIAIWEDKIIEQYNDGFCFRYRRCSLPQKIETGCSLPQKNETSWFTLPKSQNSPDHLRLQLILIIKQ